MCRLAVKSKSGDWQNRVKDIHSIQLLYFLTLKKSCSSFSTFFLHKIKLNIHFPAEIKFYLQQSAFVTSCKIHRLEFVKSDNTVK